MLWGRVLTGFVAAGIVLAALVLYRIKRLGAARWIAVALGVYGAAAFAHAAVTGLPLRVVLGGGGLFRSLPYVLQAAFVGACVVLPLGWIAAVVRAGIPRLRGSSPRRALYEAVALTVAVALVAASIPRSDAVGAAAPTATARAAQLDRSLRALEDGDRDLPRDRWDPDYVVGMVGRDPQRLFEWVRDNTYWVPYRGELRGPVGVLMDRQGNSLDRALLLAALLEKAGLSVRLAQGELASGEAATMLPALVARRTGAFGPLKIETGTVDGLRETASSYQLDYGAMEGQLARLETAGQAALDQLDKRVSDQTARLSAALGRRDDAAEWTRNLVAATRALEDHWWVQQQNSGAWIDWDLLDAPGGHSAITAPTTTYAAADLPDDLHHEVVVRVVTERWSRGAPREARVMEHRLRPAEMAGRSAVLQFWPGAWPSEVARDPDGPHGMKAAALEQTEWAAVLQIDGRPAAQGVISEAGEPGAQPGANPFGGLASSFTATMQQGSTSAVNSPLTASWIEYEIRVPGEPARVTRRTVFDLLGPARRAAHQAPRLPLTDAQRLTRSLSLMMRTEILPIGCAPAPTFLAHLANQALRKDTALLRAVALDDPSVDLEHARKLLADAAPPASPLDMLALARSTWGRLAHKVIVSQPNVLTRHHVPVAQPQGIVLEEATDIVANGLGVDPAEPHPFAARLERGVYDTNAEALLELGPASWNTANAFAESQRWATVAPGNRGSIDALRLPDDAKQRMLDDVDAGFVVVAPDLSAGDEASRGFVGWWRIDPRSGEALGIDGQGWGSSLTERGVLLNLANQFAMAFNFEFALCMAIPQAVNALVVLKETALFKLGLPQHVKPYDPGELFNKSGRMCLFQAIASGFVATLPLLLISLRPRMQRMVLRGPDQPGIPRENPPPEPSGPKQAEQPPRCDPDANAGPAGTSTPPEAAPIAGTLQEPAPAASRVSAPNPLLGSDAISPADYTRLLEELAADRVQAEGVARQAHEAYTDLARRGAEAEAKADALKAQYYDVQAQGTSPSQAQDLSNQWLQASQEARELLDEELPQARKELAKVDHDLNLKTRREGLWRSLENENRRWYEALQQYRDANRAFDEYRLAHPQESLCDAGYWEAFSRRSAADEAVAQARREMTQRYLDSSTKSPGGAGNTLPLPDNANPSPQAPPPAPAGQSGNTLPLLPAPGGQSGNTLPLLPAAGGQSGGTLPLLPPVSKTVAGQLGVANALSVPK